MNRFPLPLKLAMLLASLQLPFAPAALALTPGYQASFGAGMDYPDGGSARGVTPFLTTQLGSKSTFLRVHVDFTFLYGTGYMEGEGGLGMSIYPLSSFVSEKAKVHPFLVALGSFGVARLGSSNTTDTGAAYGAGVDVNFWRRSGITITAQKYMTKDPSMRYTLGIHWFRKPQ